MSELDLTIPSAASVELPGSVGTFSISPRASHPYHQSAHYEPLTVTYFLSYVSLTLAGGVQQQLLSHLKPVREVFDLAQLEFDELMQRDIDDARVADELIPYILDPRTSQLVKLFPPIVVTVMPTGETALRPGRLYPEITDKIQSLPERAYDLRVLQSGEPGSEIFRIEHPTKDGTSWHHDLARLHLNPQGSRLVIVDGQHRAMALLALHRNLTNEWADKDRAPYAPFYSQWSPDVLQHYDLSNISLPVMLCTVTELDINYQGDFDLLQANRSIFLALNKNARRVTVARNRLLDDNDMVAECLRELLNNFKNRPDISATDDDGSTPPLWSVELDQEADRVRLSTPAAVTGVNHLYTLILHLVMRDEYTTGAKQRPGRIARRRRLDEMVFRLGLEDALGTDAAATLRRDNYDSTSARILRNGFMTLYGESILRLFSTFPFLRAQIEAFAEQRLLIQNEESPEIERLVFGGGGASAALEDHRKRLRRQMDAEQPLVDADQANDALRAFQRFRKRTEYHEEQAGARLRERLLPRSDGSLPELVQAEVMRLARLSRSTAFQIALVATFTEVADRRCESLAEADPDIDRAEVFENLLDDYIASLIKWFDSSQTKVLSRLSAIFIGMGLDEIEESAGHSVDAFRTVVFGTSELQPRLWPRLRVLFLEVWEPTDSAVKSIIDREREYCWNDIVESLFVRLLREQAQEYATRPESLEQEAVHNVFEVAVSRTETLLSRFRRAHFNRDQVWDAIVAAGYIDDEDEDEGVDALEDELAGEDELTETTEI